VNAMSHLHYREQRLSNARAEIRSVYRAGGMSSQELYDLLNFAASQCDEHDAEQKEIREKLSTICADMENDEPDADAFRRFPGPATLDSRLERV
jgi:hypothetical protein